MELVFLGTSGMQPTKERNHPSVILLYKGEGILFDCGEGTQRQLRAAGIKPTIIRKIFLTHWHGDHVLGLPGLLQTMSASEYSGTVEIYGPKGTKKFVEMMNTAFASADLLELSVTEVGKGEICTTQDYTVESDELVHGVPCVGFAFREKDVFKIQLPRAKKLGIPEGPLLGKLQGGESIIYKGKKIAPLDVATLARGRKIVYVMDTRPCNGAVRLAKDADLLIIESTYTSEMEEKAKEYFHMTAHEAATIANQAGVKRLILTHFSARYKDPHEVEDDARLVFDGAEAAEDLRRVRL